MQADEQEPETPAPTTYRDADDTDRHPALTHITVNPPTAQLVNYETETDIKSYDRMPSRTRPLPSHPRPSPLSRRHAHWHTHPHSHLPAVPTSLGDQSESEYSDELETTEDDSEDTIALRSEPIDTGFSTEAEDPVSAPTPAPLPSSPSSVSNVHSMLRWDRETSSSPCCLFTRLLAILASLSPPLIASLLALFCVLVPPIQRLLISEVMIPFKGALNNAGGCSIPLTLIVLGGWFWDGETKPKVRGRRVAEGEVKGVSGGQANRMSKGKGVEKYRGTGVVPTFLDERQGHSHSSGTENAPSHLGHHVTSLSRDSSTASLSSMIGAFGDVLMAHIHRRGRARRRARGNVGVNKSDLEPGLLTTHTETESEDVDNRPGRSSRSRSQADPVNGRAQLSPISSSSPASQPPPPKSPHARGTNPPGETLTICITLLVRMVIVPLIITPIMILIRRLGWGGEIFEEYVQLSPSFVSELGGMLSRSSSS